MRPLRPNEGITYRDIVHEFRPPTGRSRDEQRVLAEARRERRRLRRVAVKEQTRELVVSELNGLNDIWDDDSWDLKEWEDWR